MTNRTTLVKRVTLTSVAILVVGSFAAAQAPTPPKPGPEHKPLGYFVGKWKSEGELKAGPMGPGGKTSSTDTCEWFSGSFQVVCRGDGTMPAGSVSGLGVIAYSAADKGYTYYGIDSMGMSELSRGQKKGNTWTFTATSHVGGQSFQSRYTIVETSPTSYTFKWEYSKDKKTWEVLGEGKATKVS
jgi:hypothetical protein